MSSSLIERNQRAEFRKVHDEQTNLKIKSPFFCIFFFGELSIFSSVFAAIEEMLSVPAAFSLVYSDSPLRAARSRMFLSTVSESATVRNELRG